MNAKLCILGTRGEIKIKVPKDRELARGRNSVLGYICFWGEKVSTKNEKCGNFFAKKW